MTKLVGLTGGIGSGKSTVSRLLAQRGAQVIDADQVARDLQAAGSPVVAAMAEAFGDEILLPDGNLDRPAVAALVFGDSDEARANLKRLNAITHPAIRDKIQTEVDVALAKVDSVVVVDHPLLAEALTTEGLSVAWVDAIDMVVVVDVNPAVQLTRLVGRGLSADDAERRIASQISRQERLAVADVVIDNSGDIDALEREVELLWAQLDPTDGDTAVPL